MCSVEIGNQPYRIYMPVGRTADESPRAHVDQLSTGPWRGRRHSARFIMSIETAQKPESGATPALSKREPLAAQQDIKDCDNNCYRSDNRK